MLPLNRPSLPIILTFGGFLVPSDYIEHAEHLGLALVDPCIEQKVSDLHVFSFIFKTFHYHHVQEINPVGNALNELVLFS